MLMPCITRSVNNVALQMQQMPQSLTGAAAPLAVNNAPMPVLPYCDQLGLMDQISYLFQTYPIPAYGITALIVYHLFLKK